MWTEDFYLLQHLILLLLQGETESLFSQRTVGIMNHYHLIGEGTYWGLDPRILDNVNPSEVSVEANTLLISTFSSLSILYS